ncbi:DUF4350 domain-containing protein [Kitasatospora gansuensis]
MTTSTPAPTPVDVFPGWAQLWRRSRWFLAAAAFVLLVALLISGLGGHREYPPLDPRDTDPQGTRAALHLLEERGLTTRTVSTEDELTAALAEPGSTVVVPFTAPMPSRQLVLLGRQHRGSDSRLVLIGPDNNALAAITPDIKRVPDTARGPLYEDPIAVDPGCSLPEATRAGRAELGGTLYEPGNGDVGCYAVDGHPSLVRHTDPGSREIVVLGSAWALTNDRLDEEGNASLALGLLGSRRQLVWYLPDYSNMSTVEQSKSLADFIPAGTGPHCNSASPPCSPPSGGPADWARWSPRSCPSWSAPPRPPRAGPGSTTGRRPAAGPPTPCAGPPGTGSPPPWASRSAPANPTRPPCAPPSPTASSSPPPTCTRCCTAPHPPTTPRCCG